MNDNERSGRDDDKRRARWLWRARCAAAVATVVAAAVKIAKELVLWP